ncbi:MAG: hypothetical protein BRC50_11910 [Cyanobacteria bacterium SW_11_48_12]|jgi:Uma2 family endonuclease|nr:MAG: hypothetical protein BRC37_08435 [Cyanobacteria bacterium QH_3_48_40]PSP11370.1 MAG: hypothetical protein BRC50_11910 [Cyanobacteria bacterium SW_11_48_12]
MSASLSQTLTLEEFLKLPYLEESPAWEYVDGVALQKPMPKTRHSILQKRLLSEIDGNSSDYTALPELRCTFAGRSVVPDVAVITWSRIGINEAGEPEDNFIEAPDWSIAILSLEQKATRVIDNLLHCLRHGCKLGWLIDPDDYSVLTFTPQHEPDICRGDRQLPVLEGVNLEVTAAQFFVWLKMGKR